MSELYWTGGLETGYGWRLLTRTGGGGGRDRGKNVMMKPRYDKNRKEKGGEAEAQTSSVRLTSHERERRGEGQAREVVLPTYRLDMYPSHLPSESNTKIHPRQGSSTSKDNDS